MYSALTIAKHVIRYCAERGKLISNLKLQKVLYFVQAEFLVDTGSCCFSDRIEAWPFGPVVPSVYRVYRMYGGAQIPVETAADVCPIAKEDMQRVSLICDECSKYSSSLLMDATLRQSPWIDAYSRPGINNEITPESIRSFFSEPSRP